MTSQKKLDSLTGLRYFAALSVVFAHIGGNLPGSWRKIASFLQNGSYGGMTLFFVLSGFLMVVNYGDAFEKRVPGTTRRFFVARLARIYPIYLLTLLLWFSFGGTFFHDLTNRPYETMRCVGWALALVQNWSYFLVFADYLNPRAIGLAYNPVSWSVSVEAFFYFIFPLFAIWLLPKFKRRSQTVLGAIFVYCFWLAGNASIAAVIGNWDSLDSKQMISIYSNNGWVFWTCYLSPYGRLGEFLLGCFVGKLFLLQSAFVVSRREAFLSKMALWVSACGFFAWVFFPSARQLSFVSMLQMNIGRAPLCAAMIFCLARNVVFPLRFLAWKPLVLFGESSYSLYLIHSFVQCLFISRTSGEFELHEWPIILYNHAAMLVTLHILSLGLFHFVETPLREAIRSLLSPLRKTRPDVVAPPMKFVAESNAA